MKWLNEDLLQDQLLDILKEIKLLTGAILHEKPMLQVQVRMIRTFLMTSPRFYNLTTEEIRHAFYMNQQGLFKEVYKHYNKELNAEFIGDVLLGYLKYKELLYKREGATIKGLIDPPKEVPAVVIPATAWMHYIQEDYNRYRAGEVEMIFNTTPKYFFLRKSGLLFYSRKEKWQEWYKAALTIRERHNRIRPEDSVSVKTTKGRMLDMYQAIKETGVITREEHHSVLHLMRRLVYLKFFEVLAYYPYDDIFSEISHKYIQ